MPKIKVNALTDRAIKTAKPKEKDYKLSDGEGLYLLITKNGGKRWRFKYRFGDKEKVYAIGTYPAISLSKAREVKNALRSQVAEGISPADEKQAQKRERRAASQKAEKTLEVVIAESLAKRKSGLSESYFKKLEDALRRDVSSYIGKVPIKDVTKAQIIEVLERVEARGAVESAHRLLTQLNRVFKFALNRDYVSVNIVSRIDRQETLEKPKVSSYPILTDERELHILLNMIGEYSGDYSTRLALAFMPYVASRPSNIRMAEWSEICFKKKMWIIPGSKMKIKTKEPHIVPLTDSAISILRDAEKLSAGRQYIFPSFFHKNSPMSDATLGRALKRMGFSNEQIVPHSWRAIFSTITNEHIREHGVHPKIIDLQLAHSAKGKVERSYNRTDYMEERKILMQWWSDWLDSVKGGTK